MNLHVGLKSTHVQYEKSPTLTALRKPEDPRDSTRKLFDATFACAAISQREKRLRISNKASIESNRGLDQATGATHQQEAYDPDYAPFRFCC
jgi:hypothetical protein